MIIEYAITSAMKISIVIVLQLLRFAIYFRIALCYVACSVLLGY